MVLASIAAPVLFPARDTGSFPANMNQETTHGASEERWWSEAAGNEAQTLKNSDKSVTDAKYNR